MRWIRGRWSEWQVWVVCFLVGIVLSAHPARGAAHLPGPATHPLRPTSFLSGSGPWLLGSGPLRFSLTVSFRDSAESLPGRLGQESCAIPGAEDAARTFFATLGRLRWAPLSDQLHSAALLPFDQISRDLVASAQGSRILQELYGVSAEDFEGWSVKDRFAASMEAMTQYARGLMESQVMTDVTLLGQVPEGEETCHVVYREATDHMGLVLDGIHVVTLAVEEGAWRVLLNQELGVLATALRGVPIGRVPPGA